MRNKTINIAGSQKKRWRRIWNRKYCYLMLLPVLANFAIFHYWPMWGLQIAFKRFNVALGITKSPWIGFKNFASFFNGAYFWPLIRNTLTLSIWSIIIGFPMPILLALLLNETRNLRYKRVAQTVSYLPYFMSETIIVSLLTMFFGGDGVLNTVLHNFGGESIKFMESRKWFCPLYVGSSIWSDTGFSAIIYLAAITGIDPQLYEAAELDGANRMQLMWHITLREIAPTVAILFIMRMGGILSLGWTKVLLMQNLLNTEVSEVIQTYVYKRGIINSDYGFGTAVGLFQSVISMIFVVAANQLSKRISDSEVSLF